MKARPKIPTRETDVIVTDLFQHFMSLLRQAGGCNNRQTLVMFNTLLPPAVSLLLDNGYLDLALAVAVITVLCCGRYRQQLEKHAVLLTQIVAFH